MSEADAGARLAAIRTTARVKIELKIGSVKVGEFLCTNRGIFPDSWSRDTKLIILATSCVCRQLSAEFCSLLTTSGRPRLCRGGDWRMTNLVLPSAGTMSDLPECGD